GVRGRVRLRDRPRPPARFHDRALPLIAGALDLALPHRPLGAESERARLPAAGTRTLRRGNLPHERVRPRGPGLASLVHLAAGDRPADAEEHGAFARGRGLQSRPVRTRRRAAAADAGIALRSVIGPTGRDRRLPGSEGAL